ncbi:MAG: YbaB/EbfC family nucleoid-associated protein [bacterium]
MEGMNNVSDQITKLKKELEKLEAQLKERKVYGKENHGLVTTVVNGQGKIVDFEFNEGVVDEEFKKAIIDSINDGLERAKRLKKKKKQEIIGDLQIPDMPGLF